MRVSARIKRALGKANEYDHSHSISVQFNTA